MRGGKWNASVNVSVVELTQAVNPSICSKKNYHPNLQYIA